MINFYKELYLKFSLKALLSPSRSEMFERYRGKKKCIVCLAADYGNLGDVAITYAQEQYLEKIFPGYEIVDFPISKTLGNLKALKNICNADDIITIVGGGNMGDLYGDIELLRLMIVKAFPHNRIISFPQTIEYIDTAKNRFLYNLSKRIYNGHKNLLMCARESVSYSKMREVYPKCNVCFVPDIVMTLDKRSDNIKREDNIITLCVRNDKEKKKTALDEDLLKSQLIEQGYKLNISDTHIGKSRMSMYERETELQKIWDTFSKSKLVITDRLHGMIFAYITGTPALVLPNSNFKVEKCYEWIKDCEYVEFIKEPTNEVILSRLGLKFSEEGFESTYSLINDKMKVNIL